MTNYSKIQFTTDKKRETVNQGQFNGLTFMQSNWGNIGIPVPVNSVNDLINKFGTYNSLNKDDWFQSYNFLQYSRNLKIFRAGWKENTPTFNIFTGTMTDIFGSSHSHLFIHSIVDFNIVYEWNENNNGSGVYLKINDMTSAKNIPEFNSSAQLLFVAGKYPGSDGNDIGLTIANYYTDLDNSYVFKHTALYVGNITGFVVGQTIQDLTTGLKKATIKQIDTKQQILYVEMISGTFTTMDTIDFGMFGVSIGQIIGADDYDYNPLLRDVFSKPIEEDEIGIVVTYKDAIQESEILSFNYEKDNYIELFNSQWLTLISNPVWEDPANFTILGFKQQNTCSEMTNEKLLFGVSTFLPEPEVANQLDFLKSINHANFDVLFTETTNQDIYNSLVEINNLRNDFILIFNRIDSLEELVYLVDHLGNYVVDINGDFIIVP